MLKNPWLRLNISNLCNFSCKYCHVFKITPNLLPKALMDFQTMDAAIKNYLKIMKTSDTKQLQISIYGGEPLLNKNNLFKIIKKYGNRHSGINLRWIVNTNGSLLEEKDVLFFKQYDVDIHISCDGDKQTHNKTKVDKLGRGTFQLVSRALGLIKKHKPAVQINSYVMPENLEHLKEIVDVAQNFNIQRIYLDLFYAPRMLDGRLVAEKYFQVLKYAQNQNIIISGPGNEIVDNYLQNIFYEYPSLPSIDVNADGSWFFSRIPVIEEREIFSLPQLKKEFVFKKYRQLQKKADAYLAKKCRNCFLQKFCAGKSMVQFQYHTHKKNGYGQVCLFMEELTKKMAGDSKLQTVQIAITYGCNKNCYYCYAKDLKNFYQPMTLDDFTALLEWLQRQGIGYFNLTGGEPTTHPEIENFIGLAEKRNFKIGLFTNGLFPESERRFLKKCSHFLINYNPASHYTLAEFKLLNENLAWLAKAGKSISLMFNITEKITTAEHILKVCRKYPIKEVLLDLTIPNALKSNDFVKINLFRKKKKLLLKFLKEFKKMGVSATISRPMPRCLFGKKELSWLRDNNLVRHRCGIGEKIIAINPDLSVFPCLSIFLKGPNILSLPGAKSYQDYFKKSMDVLKWQRPLFSYCKACLYFKQRECQGACLGHKCREFFTVAQPRFFIFSQYSPSRLTQFIKTLEGAFAVLDKVFGKIDRPLKIFLFENREDFLIYSGLFDYPEWVCASTFPADFEYYQYSKSAADLVIKGFLHEITHFYIQYFSRSGLPNWLTEGFCELMNFYGQDNRKKLLDLTKKKKLIPFEKLHSWNKLSLLAYDPAPLPQNIAYQQSHNFVRYLAQRFGPQKLMGLITGNYDDFYEYFRELTGFDFFVVEKEWLVGLRGGARIDPHT